MSKKEKKAPTSAQSYRKKTFRNGSYSLGVTLLVLIVLVVINLVAGVLPTTLTTWDLSPSMLYTIGDTTKEYVSGLDQDVDIIVVAESDSVDERILNFLDKYAALSSHIHVEQIDPVLHPDVLEKYDVASDNLVVSCEATGRSTNILFSSIIVQELNQYYYQTYGQVAYNETEFDGEGQLTSAIDYVTSTTSHQMYALTGHGESAIGTGLSELITKANITLNTLDLMQDSAIPEDCEVLLINGATSDITADETTLLLDYLAGGGNLVITLASPTAQLPNLEAVLNDYGLETEVGYVSDLSRYYQTNLFAIFPVVQDTSTISSLGSDTYILTNNNTALKHIDGVRSSLEFNDLLTTSENGYLYIDQNDKQGPEQLLIGVSVTETVGDKTAQLLVFGSSAMADATVIDQFTNVGNASAFIDSISGMFPDMNNISIPAKSLEVSYNTVTGGLTWGIIFFAVIPVALLLIGFVIWFRRRRR